MAKLKKKYFIVMNKKTREFISDSDGPSYKISRVYFFEN